MAEKEIDFGIEESDEAGNVTATYVQSPTDQEGLSRIDVVVSLCVNFRGLSTPQFSETNHIYSFQKSANQCGKGRLMCFFQPGSHIVLRGITWSEWSERGEEKSRLRRKLMRPDTRST